MRTCGRGWGLGVHLRTALVALLPSLLLRSRLLRALQLVARWRRVVEQLLLALFRPCERRAVFCLRPLRFLFQGGDRLLHLQLAREAIRLTLHLHQ